MQSVFLQPLKSDMKCFRVILMALNPEDEDHLALDRQSVGVGVDQYRKELRALHQERLYSRLTGSDILTIKPEGLVTPVTLLARADGSRCHDR
jgi:hypothetical protein